MVPSRGSKEVEMKKMFVAAMMVLTGFLAGCSDNKFALEATPGQRGAGSFVQLDGNDGVMTIVALMPDHPDAVKYHVTRKDEGVLEKIGNVTGSKIIQLHVKELNMKINFTSIPHQGYLCVDCMWLKLPQNWAVKVAQ
jgi:hypothetical protein